MNAITLRYRRIHKVIEGEYPYEGSLSVNDQEEVFKELPFRKIIGRIHELLASDETIESVVFHRTDRAGIVPFALGPNTVALLRKDPVSAYREMNFNQEPSFSATGSGVGREFSRHVYLAVSNGRVEDPITGLFLTLAYGHKQGWKIRGEENSSSKWLPLVGLIDDAPEGVVSYERIVFARWALVDVEELLKTEATRFYLPRPWNHNGPWITREELQHLYNKIKETAA